MGGHRLPRRRGRLDGAQTPQWSGHLLGADVVALGKLMREFEEQMLPQIAKLSTRQDPEGELAREHGASIG